MKASNYLVHYHNGAMAAAGLIALVESDLLDWREQDKFGMTLEQSLTMSKSMNMKQIDEVASVIYTKKDLLEKLEVNDNY